MRNREFSVEEKLEKKLSKIFKKDKALHKRLAKKIQEILTIDNVNHYKNLRYDISDQKRVQIGPFVLVFNYDQRNDHIYFLDFDHHDNIYGKEFSNVLQEPKMKELWDNKEDEEW